MRLLLFLFPFVAISCFGQVRLQKVLDPSDQEWGQGSILLNDGTELKGLIKYNHREGILGFESGSISRSFTARNVSRFEFYDVNEQKQRLYFSIDYEDSKTNVVVPFFFELIKDLKHFAVLMKKDIVEIDINSSPNIVDIVTNPNGIAVGGGSVKTYSASQIQTIYIMDTEGNIVPYLKVIKFDLQENQLTTKSKLLGRNILENYIHEPWFSKIKKYAHENELEFNDKEDFLKILDYYESLVKS